MLKRFWLGVNPLIPLKYLNVSIFGCSFQLLINCPGTQFGLLLQMWDDKMMKTAKQLIAENTSSDLHYPFPICRVWGAPSSWAGRKLVWGRLTSAFPALVTGVAKHCSGQSRANLASVQHSWKSSFSFGQTSLYLKDFISQWWRSQKTKLLRTALIVLRSFRRKGKSSRDLFVGSGLKKH